VPNFYAYNKGTTTTGTGTGTDTKIGGEGSGGWSVDLEQFDIELVVVIMPPDLRSNNGTLAFGFSLNPHSFMRSKSL